MKEPQFIPISETELKLRTKLKTFFLCEEDEAPCFEDIAYMVVLVIFVLVPMVMGLGVMVLNR